MKILVSGGTGYIGSHTVVELLNSGHEVVIFDNLYNSKIEVLDKIKEITGKDVKFYKADMLDTESMRVIFEENTFDCVIHFAGLKAVGESVKKPLMYYENNIGGTLNLCKLMNEYGCKRIIFSSSVSICFFRRQEIKDVLAVFLHQFLVQFRCRTEIAHPQFDAEVVDTIAKHPYQAIAHHVLLKHLVKARLCLVAIFAHIALPRLRLGHCQECRERRHVDGPLPVVGAQVAFRVATFFQ